MLLKLPARRPTSILILIVPRPSESHGREMTAMGFEPTQLALVELESTPLDHSGKLSLQLFAGGRCMRSDCSRKIGATRLSLTRTHGNSWGIVPRGLEPRTLMLLAVRSNQLGYDTLANYLRLW